MRLDAIKALVPEARLEVREIIAAAGGNSDEIRIFTQLFGMQRVAAADPKIGVAGYLEQLLNQLSDSGPQGPQVLIHAHSLPLAPGRLPDMESFSRHPILSQLVAVWDMDQFNCAGMFHAMQAAERLLAAGEVAEVLVFAGDCLADWPMAARYVPSCTVLGDGYAILRLSAAPGGVQIGPVSTCFFRGFEGGLDGGATQIEAYNRAHVSIIREALNLVGHLGADAMVFPHNINGLAWRMFCRQTGQNAAKVHDGLVRETGHCCNADPFITLERALRDGPVAGTLLSVGMAGFVGSATVAGVL